PHGKVVTRIDDGCRLGTDLNSAGESLGGDGAIGAMKYQMKIAKELHRVSPCLEPAVFRAEYTGSHADHIEEFPGMYRALNEQIGRGLRLRCECEEQREAQQSRRGELRFPVGSLQAVRFPSRMEAAHSNI